MKFILVAVFMLMAGTVLAGAEPGARDPKNHPAFQAFEADAALPNVLLIGDSISIDYTIPVREKLKGAANVYRIPENGGPTSTGVAKIEAWLGDRKWSVIHFNWGLHDIKLMNGKHQVAIEDYEKNLRALVEKMKATGATLIWCSTTPVPTGKLSPPRIPGDEVKFNAVARKVMDEAGARTNDLHAFAAARLAEIQQKENVHFSAKGSAALAEPVAEAIRTALKK